MKLTSLFSMLLAAVLFVSACEDEEAANDVVAKMKADPNLSALVAAIETAGLADDLASATNVTIFAPTNTAIGTNLNGVSGDRLVKILKYHVATSRIVASELTGADKDSTQHETLLTGNSIFIVNAAGTLHVNGNTTYTSSIRTASQGSIPSFKGNAGITSTIEAGNGVIHVVNSLLWPDEELTVLEVAAKRYTIASAFGPVILAGLATSQSPLWTGTNITLFAPDNVTIGLVQAQGGIPTASLAPVLNTHIIPSQKVLTSGLTNLASFQTNLSGVTVTSIVNGTTIILRTQYMNSTSPAKNAAIVGPNIVAKNGVIHLIRGILEPAAPTAPAKAF